MRLLRGVSCRHTATERIKHDGMLGGLLYFDQVFIIDIASFGPLAGRSCLQQATPLKLHIDFQGLAIFERTYLCEGQPCLRVSISSIVPGWFHTAFFLKSLTPFQVQFSLAV